MFAMPAISVWKFFRVPGRWSKVKRWRLYPTIALAVVALIAIFYIPFRCRVWAPFELQPHDAASVYVEVPGRLVEMAVKPGDVVTKGQLIARLENLELEMKAIQLEGEVKSYQAQVDSLQQLVGARPGSDEMASNLSTAREKLASAKSRLEKQRTDLAKLVIVAPRDGTIIPPPRVPEQHKIDEVQLTTWTGTPLDKENLGAHLTPEGQHSLLCQIGDPNDWDAVMTIDQNNFPIREGDEVRLMFEESAYHVFITQISNWSADVQATAPPHLASTNGGPLASKANPDGSIRPLNTSYQASARLDNPSGLLRNGLIGMARIETQPRTLAARFWHYISHTFNFQL
jgi:hypothetical protein